MKLIVQVLCPPCQKCHTLLQHLEKAMQITGTESEITHVTNFKEFSKYSVSTFQTPILVINGHTEFAGGAVPFLEQLSKRISDIKAGL